MSDNTKIEWTDATWNIITGCSVVSSGCKNCYAMKLAGTRLKHHPSRDGLTIDTKNGPVWNGQVRLNPLWLHQPLRWSKPRMIFVCAHGDLFHESVPDDWIDTVFAVMALAKQHVFQVLTKRPERMRKYFEYLGYRAEQIGIDAEYISGLDRHLPDLSQRWTLPLSNVWLGVSVENQEAADKRIPILLDTPAAVRWISAEPLLGKINLSKCGNSNRQVDALTGTETTGNPISSFGKAGFDQIVRYGWHKKIDWLVVGGESGDGSRPMHPEWARSLRDQCAATSVPFLFKQWGDWVPRSACYHTFDNGNACVDLDPEAKKWPCIRLTESGLDGRNLENEEQGDSAYMQKVGKKMAGRLLDGVTHDGYPERSK
jgi:protein gp37